MRILYIDIDSLRPKHLGCYGYHRPTSPKIDEIAAKGVTIQNLYATDTPCLPSRTAFFSGKFGTTTGVVNHGGQCAELPHEGLNRHFRSPFAESTLGSLFTRSGYHTCMISPFPRRHSAYPVTYGFHETHDTGKGGLENADEIYPVVENWLKANGTKENWFLHVNFWDPHTPYDTPEQFGNPFADHDITNWLTQDLIDQQRASFGPHSAREVPDITPDLPPIWRWGVGEIKNLQDAKTHIDGYDTGVLYADLYVGKIMSLLQELGIQEETAVIITADHGENLGELNVWGDHQTADEWTNHIPGVIYWPGVTDAAKGTTQNNFHYNIDLAATIVDLASDKGQELTKNAGWQGESFASVFKGQPGGRNEVYLSQGAWSCQRSVRWGDYIYIQTTHTGMKDFPADMLFNLAEDPHETNNLAPTNPELVKQAKAKLTNWFADKYAQCPYGDPFETVIKEGGPLHARVSEQQAYLKRLRETGRAHHADWLERTNSQPES